MEGKNNMTNKEMFKVIREEISKLDIELSDAIVEFCDRQISILEAKAVKAKEKALEKKKENDELKDIVKSVLTNEYKTINEIVAEINDEDVTKGKVTSRLTSLIKEGIAQKDDIKNEDNKKVKAYRLFSEE